MWFIAIDFLQNSLSLVVNAFYDDYFEVVLIKQVLDDVYMVPAADL